MNLPFPAMFAAFILSFGAASAPASVAAPASAAAPTGEGAVLRQVYQQLYLAHDQLGACGRDARGVRMGVAAAMWDIGDRIRLTEGEAAAKALSSLPKLAAPACGTPQDLQLLLFAHEQSFESISRLMLLQMANGGKGWSASLGAVPSLPRLLEPLRMQLGQNVASVRGVPAVEGRVQQLGRDVETELALVCEARKTVRSVVPRACPALPATITKAQRDLAAARIANLELLAERINTPGENPFGAPFGYHSSAAMMDWIGRVLTPCDKARNVVYLGDPGGVRSAQGIALPVRVFETGNVVGRVNILPVTSKFPTALTPAQMTSGVEEYNRCPNDVP